MRPEVPVDSDRISDEELTEVLAGAEEATPEKIKRGAAELDIAPSEETTVDGQ